jgi:ssDNA-binding Zn-finger/Zn-ribbon topoisomerase 1
VLSLQGEHGTVQQQVRPVHVSCHGKPCDVCDYFRHETVSVVLPDIDSKTVEVMLCLLYTGEAVVEEAREAAELISLGHMLGITLPADMARKLASLSVVELEGGLAQEMEEEEEKEKPKPQPQIRVRSTNELLKSPKAKKSRTESPTATAVSCPDCGKKFMLNVALDRHRKKSCSRQQAQPEQVMVEVNPEFDDGLEDEVGPDTSQNGYEDEDVDVTNNGSDDDDLQIVDMLPPPPPPLVAEAILNMMQSRLESGIQVPGIQVPGIQLAPMKPKQKSPSKKLSPAAVDYPWVPHPMEELTNKAGATCPICNKFYPNGKKREHFASSHFNQALRQFVTTEGGRTTCILCGKNGTSMSQIARHTGLLHNKLMEVVGEEHMHFIDDMRGSHRQEEVRPEEVPT